MTVLRLRIGGESREVRLGEGSAAIDGRTVAFREVRRSGDLVAIESAGEVHPVRVARQGERVFVWFAGEVYEAQRDDPRSRARAPRGRSSAGEAHGDLLAPMPGRVRRNLVRQGDSVSKGEIVLVLEAMKMEHAIRAPRDGVVTRLDHAEGDLVEAGTVLAEISGGGKRETEEAS